MSDEHKEDEASIASVVEYFMNSTADIRDGEEPWEVTGYDLGEVEIKTFNGQLFRLTIEEVIDGD